MSLGQITIEILDEDCLDDLDNSVISVLSEALNNFYISFVLSNEIQI